MHRPPKVNMTSYVELANLVPLELRLFLQIEHGALKRSELEHCTHALELSNHFSKGDDGFWEIA